MADSALRRLERKAANGGVLEKAALLHEKLRCGLLTQEQIELAAYCEDRAAREVLGAENEAWRCLVGARAVYRVWRRLIGASTGLSALPELASLPDWLRGLSRWEQVPTRAACTAARLVLPRLNDGTFTGRELYGYWPAGRALEAAEAYVDCPCEKHQAACRKARESGLYPDTTGWIWHLVWAIAEGAESHSASLREAIQDAATRAGEQPVRDAICAELRKWSTV